MRRRFLILLLLSVLCLPTAIGGAPAKTIELVALSGAQDARPWTEDDKVEVGGREVYFTTGTILLTLREPSANPLEVVIWGRGFGDIFFFELTPLVGVMDGIGDANALRELLVPQPGNNNGRVVPGNTDRERLQAISNEEGQGKADNALRAKRAIALTQMNLNQKDSFDELWKLYESQRNASQNLRVSELEPATLLRFWQPGYQATGKPSQDWTQLERVIRDKGRALPLLRTQLFSPAESKVLGYLIRQQGDPHKKVSGEILVGTGSTEPVVAPLTLEVAREDTIFSSFPKFGGAVIPGLLSGLIGAMLAYWGFRIQQRVMRKNEEQKSFTQRKAEHFTTLWEFFRRDGTYDRLSDTGSGKPESVIENVHKVMIQRGIISLLPVAELQELIRILKSETQDAASRQTSLHNFLERNFKEFRI